MIDFADNLLHNKYAVRTAIGQIKVLNKIKKNQDKLKSEFEPEMKNYKESQEYKDLVESLKKIEEEDDYKNDPDPEGFDLFEKCLSNPGQRALEVATKVVGHNPESAELHAKVIPVFLSNGKLMMALKSAKVLKEKHADHPKTLPALRKFFTLWRSLSDEQKQTDFKDDAKLIKLAEMELVKLGCPKDMKAVEDLKPSTDQNSLAHINEWSKYLLSIKQLDAATFEKAAIEAISGDKKYCVFELV